MTKTIPQLNAGTAPVGGEPFETVQGGVSVRLTADQLLTRADNSDLTIAVGANGTLQITTPTGEGGEIDIIGGTTKIEMFESSDLLFSAETGTIEMTAGVGGHGGDISVTKGSATIGGGSNLSGGSGSNQGGAVNLTGGTSSAGTGGAINLSGNAGLTGGGITITSGDGSAGPGGNVTITTGAGSTTQGLISLQAPAWQALGVTVANLPAAATAGVGARAFVTNATTTTTLGIGTTVVGGGANKVPVYSDGAAWKIG